MCPLTQRIVLKRSNTLALEIKLKSGETYLPVADYTFSCSLRASSGDIIPLTVTNGVSFVTIGATAAQTALWPLGTYTTDIRVVRNADSVIVNSSNFYVDVQEAITNG